MGPLIPSPPSRARPARPARPSRHPPTPPTRSIDSALCTRGHRRSPQTPSTSPRFSWAGAWALIPLPIMRRDPSIHSPSGSPAPDRSAWPNRSNPPSPLFVTFTHSTHFPSIPLMSSHPARPLTRTEPRSPCWFVSSETWSPRVPFPTPPPSPSCPLHASLPAPPPLRSPAAVVTLF